ncbi:MAG: hypothetical protein LBC61_05765 [Candidatus Peribacteria bacterium]|nr:hypothetical protein [Candidatus Peribacteria bacterium]
MYAFFLICVLVSIDEILDIFCFCQVNSLFHQPCIHQITLIHRNSHHCNVTGYISVAFNTHHNNVALSCCPSGQI